MHHDRLRQLLRLPRTLLAIARMAREDASIAAADEHLWAFRGFHLESWDPHYRARSWERVALGDIRPDQVVGLPVGELAFMMHVAMEIEDPILEYSQQNGEGFRVLLPTLGRFMGKSDAEAAYAEAHGLTWCESPWCAEERRHGNAFAKAIERLTAAAPPRDNPNEPRALTADEAEALQHLISRQAAEWSSSSTYLVMAAHASGSLHKLLRNMARDEIKHLCILSAADTYLLGPRAWRRLGDLIRVGLENYRGQKRRRSDGQRIGANAVSALEVVAAHLLVEYHVRRWLKSLPIGTVSMVFETASSLPDLPRLGGDAEDEARREEARTRGRQQRLDLARWSPAARRRALDERRVEATHAAELTTIIDAELNGFRGAEAPGASGVRAARRRIARARPAALRAGLRRRLRDYQLRHNRHVLARQG